jgi:hypothetical protein
MSGPSVNPVLLVVVLKPLYLASMNHRIYGRCPPMDRRFIRRLSLHCFISGYHPVHLEIGPSSDHPTVSLCCFLCVFNLPLLEPNMPSLELNIPSLRASKYIIALDFFTMHMLTCSWYVTFA